MKKIWTLLFSLICLLVAFVSLLNPSEAEQAKWTFMVYMGADSSLEDFGVYDFNEMARVGSTNDVKIIVQFDRRSGDWTTAKRFFVKKDMAPTPANALSDIGEVNMGDPRELVNFTLWAMEKYPAERYFLNLWGHGRGWQGVVQDASSGSDYLELDELKWAFENIVANSSGRKIDLLGADACRMTTEMNYQLKDYVKFFVGSQKDEPEPGWPYDLILYNLTKDPDMGPAELGRTIVDTYVESYIDNTGLAVALSVIDSSKLEYLGEELRRYVEQARSALPMFVDIFESARLSSEKYEGDSVYDLYDLIDKLEGSFPSPPRRLTFQALRTKEAIVAAVSYERNWDNPAASVRTTYAHGMSIWYPFGISDLSYLDLEFSSATGWGNYLLDYWSSANGDIPDPEVSIEAEITTLDTNGNGLNDTVRLELISPRNASLEIDIYLSLNLTDSSPVHLYLPAGTPRFENLTFLEERFTDLDFYLVNETGVWMNLSYYRNVLGLGYSISGFVRDRKGNDLIGAVVLVEDLDSGEKVMVNSDSLGYSAIISPPQDKDRIRVTAIYGSWSETTSFEVHYPSEGRVIDFVLGPEKESSPDTVLWVLVALIIVEGITVLVIVLFLRRGKTKPVQGSGEELLKKLKLE